MRTLAAPLLVLALAACAHPGRRISVADDGRTAIVAGQAWRAPAGVTFFERQDALHVVSLVPGATFDYAVKLDPEGRPVLSPGAPFDVRGGAIVLPGRALASVATLVDTGQLYPHDDHFHLTHRWENPDWRALYRDREDDVPLPAATRQAAAYAIAVLLDRRIPGATEEATVQGLGEMAETVARARRAVEGQFPAKQIMAMAFHDFEILDGGATLAIRGRTFKAAPGVRFTYCGDHFHVEGAGGRWAHVVRFDDLDAERFELPPSMFFEVVAGTVAPRAGDAAWHDLLARGEIGLSGDRWFVTERYGLPALQALERLARDDRAPERVRERARRSVLEVLKLPLDIDSDAAFRARLAGIDAAVEARWRELEPAGAGTKAQGKRR